MNLIWTDEVVERLKTMRSAGESYRNIGDVLGVSRNAVAGKAHRLRLEPLERKPKTPKPFTSSGFKRRREPGKITPPQPIKFEAVPVDSSPVLFEDLTRVMCKYPYGERVPFLFCGKPVLEGRHWCAEHKSVVFEPKRVRS